MSDLIERLSEAAKGKGTTFNRIEQDLHLGNGTIKRWGEQNPRLDKLSQVAEYLGLSLDYIAFGTLRSECPPNGEGLVCDGVPLSESEADLIAMFRLLPGDHQEDVYEIVRSKYDRLVEKKGSYYSACIEAEEAQESGPAESREARDGTA